MEKNYPKLPNLVSAFGTSYLFFYK
jgi:hypothetical protein